MPSNQAPVPKPFVLISAMLKWYLHHTARAFENSGCLSGYWVSNARPAGLDPMHYRRVWPYHLLKKPFYHLPFTQLEEWTRWWFLPAHDAWVMRQRIPEDCNVVMGPMGSCESLFRLADRQGRHVIKVFDAPNSHPASYVKRWRDECDTYMPGYRIPFPAWAAERMSREIQAADLILCPSLFVKESMMAHGVPERKCFVRHFGVDTSIFQPRERMPEKPVLVCVGSVCLRKGHQYLFRAFELLKRTHPEARLICIGGVRPDFAREWLKWRESIEHHPSVSHSQIAAIFREASAFVLASVEEGFARVLSEAMAAGLPVIATHETGITTVTRRDEAAWVVPARDPEALHHGMRILCDDRQLNERMARSSLEIGRRSNTWQDYGDAILRRLQEELDSRNATGKQSPAPVLT